MPRKKQAKHRNDMVDTEAIRRRMKECRVRMCDLSAALDITENSLRNKLHDGNFDLVEAYRTSQFLKMDLVDTFFKNTDSVEILKKITWGCV